MQQIKVQSAPLTNSFWRERWIAQGESESIFLTARVPTGEFGRLSLHQQPDGSIVLAPEVVSPSLPPGMHHRLSVAMLDAATKEAARRRATVISVVPFVEVSFQLATALQKFGFRCSANIQQWRRPYDGVPETTHAASQVPENITLASHRFAGGHPDVFPFQRLTIPPQPAGRQIDDHIGRTEILSLLDSFLDESDDFSEIVPSSPELMLQMWELIDSQIDIVVARQNSELCGLAVFNSNSHSAVSYAPAKNTTTSSTAVTAEYIGVCASHRRRGIGTMLLQSLTRLHPALIEVSVFVSETNTPALSMYQQLGFVCHDSSPLWLMNLADPERA